MKTDLFQSCGHCCIFQICWHMECNTFTASSFRIWNSSTVILSPPLALFIVMLPKVHLTSHSRMFGSRWEITPSCLSASNYFFQIKKWKQTKNLFYLHFWKLILLDITFFCDRFIFSFSILNMSSHFLWLSFVLISQSFIVLEFPYIWCILLRFCIGDFSLYLWLSTFWLGCVW